MIQHVLIGILMLGGLAAHASDPSDQVALTVLPSRPVVILGDTRESATGRIIKGPWFALQIALSNTFVETVHVVNVRLNVVRRINGVVIDRIVSTFAPSDFSYDITCRNGVTGSVFYTDFGTFDPMQSERLHLVYRGISLPKECLGQKIDKTIPIFYVEGLPKGSSYEYEVSGLVSGWFETGGKPTRRFEQVVSFKTQ